MKEVSNGNVIEVAIIPIEVPGNETFKRKQNNKMLKSLQRPTLTDRSLHPVMKSDTVRNHCGIPTASHKAIQDIIVDLYDSVRCVRLMTSKRQTSPK